MGLSLTVHLLTAAGFLLVRPDTQPVIRPPLQLALVAPTPQAPPMAPVAPSLAVATAAPQPRPRPRPRRHIAAAPAAEVQAAAGAEPGLGEAELAGAAVAGAAGSGACDMPGRVQRALRDDRTVRGAVAAGAAGRAFKVWNGDWLAHPGQDGHGLAAVREAILWEVGFAPAACRAERVHGLVVVSLADAPGAPRLALGGGDWRWSDLLATPTLAGAATPR